MQLFQISPVVYRRTSQTVALAALSLVVYSLMLFLQASGKLLPMAPVVIGLSIASLVIALAALKWHSSKLSDLLLFAAYLLLASTAFYLTVIVSGGSILPITVLWVIVAILASVFGMFGIVPVFIASGYSVFMSAIGGSFELEILLNTLFVSWLPLIVGYVLWHKIGSTTPARQGNSMTSNLVNELGEANSKSGVIIEAIADGVIALNGKGTIELINPAAQKILGWSAQDAVSLSYKSVFKMYDSKDKEVEPSLDPVEKAISTNIQTETDTLSLGTSSDKKLLASIIVSPVGQMGQGVIIVFRDITSDKKEEREQAEFISTASHEMRTPVASIEGYLGLALNPATATIDDKARDFIGKAHESAQHLGRLFQDLLDVSRAEDGRLANTPSVIDVVSFTGNIVEGLLPQAEAKQLRLTYKPGIDNLPDNDRRMTPVYYTHADSDHLREVISNLTENAIKYTLKGDVVIDVNGDNNHIVISFQDSGIGIPAEDISHLFQKFYRVDNSDTREIGGTGLGLYLCRRLIEVMGGQIWVESEYKKGSTFYIKLPRLDHQEASRLMEEAAVRAEEEAAKEASLAAAQPTPEIPDPTPQPIPEPVYTTEPAPAQTPQPQPTALEAQPQINTPLSTIEQNPQAYTRANNPSLNIPTRGPGGQN